MLMKLGLMKLKTRKYQIETDPNTLVFINFKKFNKKTIYLLLMSLRIKSMKIELKIRLF